MGMVIVETEKNSIKSAKTAYEIMRKEFRACVYELLKESNEELLQGYAKLICLFYEKLLSNGMPEEIAGQVASNFNLTNMYMPFTKF